MCNCNGLLVFDWRKNSTEQKRIEAESEEENDDDSFAAIRLNCNFVFYLKRKCLFLSTIFRRILPESL